MALLNKEKRRIKMVGELNIRGGLTPANASLKLRLFVASLFWLLAAYLFGATIYCSLPSCDWLGITLGVTGGLLGFILGLAFGGFASRETLLILSFSLVIFVLIIAGYGASLNLIK